MVTAETADYDNPYLRGLMAPVHAEVTATDLKVTGHIPEHLHGRYLRNGPNPAVEVNPAVYHWFTGDGMVHGVALRDGKACWYRNRWVRSAGVCRALGEPLPPRLDPRAGMQALGANTNVVEHAGRTLALVEGGVANYELTRDLATIGTCDFDGTLPGGYTAHPHRDPRTGELHAVSYSFARGRSVQYSVVDTGGRTRLTVDIEVSGSPMMHDFSLTDKYVVIYDLPVTLNPTQLLPRSVPRWLRPPIQACARLVVGQIRLPGPLVALANRDRSPAQTMPYSWNPRYPARVGVMSRSVAEATGKAAIRWFDIDPCYVYHPLNAYSEMRDGVEVLVLDVVRYATMFDRDRRGPGDSLPTLDRWTINLATGAVTAECRDDRPQEFPRINEEILGGRHRFGYSVGLDGAALASDRPAAPPMASQLYKHDYHDGSACTAPVAPGLAIGEMAFAPNPDANAEDDGVLMGFAHDYRQDTGALLFLDAQSLETMATVHLPQRVPMGFHGNWAPAV